MSASVFVFVFVFVFIEHSVVLLSGVQVSDLVIHIHIYIFFFRVFSLIGSYKILSIVLYSRTLLIIYKYSSVYTWNLKKKMNSFTKQK